MNTEAHASSLDTVKLTAAVLLLGGAVLTETVFAWPGIGRLMVGAIMERDYPLVQGTVLVFAAAFILINFLVDLSYGLINPQVARQ